MTQQEQSQVPLLRAMARNYRDGHMWDRLDGEAATKAAEEIERLRAELAELRAKAGVRAEPAAFKYTEGEKVFLVLPDNPYISQMTVGEWEALYTAPPAQSATKSAEGWSDEISNLRGLAWYFNDRELDLRIERVADGFQTVTAGGKCTPQPAQAVSVPSDEDLALDLLCLMYEAWENGVGCYEDPDDCSGYVGTAFKLESGDEEKIIGLLNRRRPHIAAAPSPEPSC